ncbi:MAG: EAL domain-containing protein, partial [Oscillospiraceae bacterium]
MNWTILFVVLLVALCSGMIGALTSLHHAAKSQTQAEPEERPQERPQERFQERPKMKVAASAPRSMEPEGMEAFCADYAALPSMEHQVVVMLYWEHLSELYNLFGSETGDATFHHFCRQCKEFAAEYDGKAYRLAFHQLALLVSAPGQMAFLDGLQAFLAEAAQLPIQKQTVLYKYQVTLLRGVYFMSAAKDAGCPLFHILDCLDHEVLYNAAISKSGDIVLDDETKPDWALLSALETEAKSSWNNHEFLPYYQPVFDIDSRKVVGCEILARWQHPTRGLLRPKQFLRILEEDGLIIDLDLYMLEEACKKISYWLECDILTVPLTVNLSKLNLYRADFVDNLLALIEKYDIPPILIELELSEKNLLFEDNDIFVEKMN